MPKLFLIWISVLVIGCQSCRNISAENTYAPWVKSGILENPALNEASGLACSRNTPGVLWVINDGGDAPMLYALNYKGEDLGRFPIRGVKNTDWEDLTSFRLNGKPYLLIADVGDNDSQRPRVHLVVVQEPRIPGIKADVADPVDIAWIISFRYEDGPRDCEAVAVDEACETVYLVSKRTRPPYLYALPLTPPGDTDQVLSAKRIMALNHLPSPAPQDIVEDPVFGPYSSQPTAMDISHNTDGVVLLTYKSAYCFHRKGNGSISEALSEVPEIIRLPGLRQAEALCFAHDGKTLFATSEKRPAPLIRIDIIEASSHGL